MSQLFYFIGASGAGKDSLMNYARTRIDGSRAVIFAHRYITRHPDHGGENHIYITPQEFQIRRDAGLFAMDWESHGQYYGIGREIDDWLGRGFHVVVNGSRQYLREAHQKYSRLKVILVEASPETIRKRLENRGREGSPDIEKRISRSGEIGNAWENGAEIIRIQNDGLLEEAGEELVRLISPPLLCP
jgi:ribose 1,5-bisphosphokinase